MDAAYGATVELPKSILVALGGVAGATARWAVFAAVDHDLWALALVNGAGTVMLGALVHDVVRLGTRQALVLGVGFCGALTTFSALAFEVAARLEAGRLAAASGLAASSLVLGLLAVSLGATLRRVTR